MTIAIVDPTLRDEHQAYVEVKEEVSPVEESYNLGAWKPLSLMYLDTTQRAKENMRQTTSIPAPVMYHVSL